jgi:hypothetical protein
MRATGLSELELGGELSGMLSRVGFLKSFNDALLDEARVALEEALHTGSADTWVTNWNLANIAARQADPAAAAEQLGRVEETIADWNGYAFVLFFIPDRRAAECLIKITDAGIASLVELQRAVLPQTGTGQDELRELLDRCRATGDVGCGQAAEWVAASVAVTS